MPRLASASLDKAIALYRVKFNRARFAILKANAERCREGGSVTAAEVFDLAADHASGQVAKCCEVLGVAGDADITDIKAPRLTVGEHGAYVARNDEHRKICNGKDRRAFKAAKAAIARAACAASQSFGSLVASLQPTPGS